MPDRSTVRVRVVSPHGALPPAALDVRHATPVGAAWSYHPELDGEPPAGIAYELNGLRTVPSAWMTDGDELVIHLPEGA